MDMNSILFNLLHIIIVVSAGIYLAFGYNYADKVVIKEFFNQCDVLSAMHAKKIFHSNHTTIIDNVKMTDLYSGIDPILRGRELRYYILEYLECIVLWRAKVNVKEWVKIVLKR